MVKAQSSNGWMEQFKQFWDELRQLDYFSEDEKILCLESEEARQKVSELTAKYRIQICLYLDV